MIGPGPDALQPRQPQPGGEPYRVNLVKGDAGKATTVGAGDAIVLSLPDKNIPVMPNRLLGQGAMFRHPDQETKPVRSIPLFENKLSENPTGEIIFLAEGFTSLIEPMVPNTRDRGNTGSGILFEGGLQYDEVIGRFVSRPQLTGDSRDATRIVDRKPGSDKVQGDGTDMGSATVDRAAGSPYSDRHIGFGDWKRQYRRDLDPHGEWMDKFQEPQAEVLRDDLIIGGASTDSGTDATNVPGGIAPRINWANLLSDGPDTLGTGRSLTEPVGDAETIKEINLDLSENGLKKNKSLENESPVARDTGVQSEVTSIPLGFTGADGTWHASPDAAVRGTLPHRVKNDRGYKPTKKPY